MGIEIPKIVLGAIGPEVVLVVAALGVMVVDLVVKGEQEREYLVWIGLAGVVGALVVGISLWGKGYEGAFGGMVVVDRYSTFFTIMFLAGSGLTLLMSSGYIREQGLSGGEYYALILFGTAGMVLMCRSTDLVMLFLGLEVMSISMYVLAGYMQGGEKGVESGMKYFILGAFSTGFLLYGVALIYGSTGSTNLGQIAAWVAEGGWAGSKMFLAGLGFLVVGFGFKVAMVPFHMWTPDVYEGAPSPVTGFMSVGVKAAAFAALVRVLVGSFGGVGEIWREILWAGSILTMSVGNISALLQSNIKRMLAYSSIAHAGYILIGVVAGGEAGMAGVLYYLLVYTLMNLGAFAVVVMVEGRGEKGVELSDYAGLGRRYPVIGAVMAVFMFSLAGIPPFSGFVGKFYVFSAAVKSGYIGLAVIGVLNSVVSVYYYLRVTVMMYMKEPDCESEPVLVKGGGLVMIALGVAVFFTIQMGVFPSGYFQLAKDSIMAFL